MKRETKKRVLVFNEIDGSLTEQEFNYPEMISHVKGTLEFTRVKYDSKKYQEIVVVANYQPTQGITTAFNLTNEIKIMDKILFTKINLKTGLHMNLTDEDIQEIKNYPRQMIINEKEELTYAIEVPLC